MKPRKQCNHAGCSILVDYDQKYCSKHERKTVTNVSYKQRKQYEGKYFMFYKSKSWKNLSYLYRLNNPCCEKCLKAGMIRKADVVDHIIEIRDDYDRRLDETNLMSLCHSCHNKKTAIEKRKRNSR